MKAHRRKRYSIIKTSFMFLFHIGLILVLTPFLINHHMIHSTKDQISYTTNDETSVIAFLSDITDKSSMQADAIIVLGASVYSDGTPSPMLKDRLDAAVDTYFKFLVAENIELPIIVSGDGGSESESYDEVHAMADYLIVSGVSPTHIIKDPHGFSTYESVYNAQTAFNVQSPIIITQEYHLYRALYVANQLNMTPTGIATVDVSYENQDKRNIREFMARTKDFFQSIVQPVPTGIRPE